MRRASFGFELRVGTLVAAAIACACSSYGTRERDGVRRDTGSDTYDQLLVPPDPTVDYAAGEPAPSVLGFDMAEPIKVLSVKKRVDLAPLFPADAQLVGVARDEFEGTLYVLDAGRGIYELVDAGAKLVFSLPDATVAGGQGDGLPPAELTDMALKYDYIEGKIRTTFVLTAENEGYALVPGSSILQSYFCYLPPVGNWSADEAAPPSVSQALRAQGIEIKERTNAVALNSASGQIFAQPRTTRLVDGEVAGSELFVFAPSGGQPIATRAFDTLHFVAGAMAASRTGVVLGSGTELYHVGSWTTDSATRVGAVAGAGSIEGATYDEEGTLLLLDSVNKQLLAIDMVEFWEELAR